MTLAHHVAHHVGDARASRARYAAASRPLANVLFFSNSFGSGRISARAHRCWHGLPQQRLTWIHNSPCVLCAHPCCSCIKTDNRRKEQTPEAALAALRKLPENRVCPDCGAESQFGFGAVVMIPCRSFVCDTCKSAHQSFSHRVKSVSMSNWDAEEVTVLTSRKGGGNVAVLAAWQGNLDARTLGKPLGAPASDLASRKAFVQRCYVEKRFYSEAAAAAPSPALKEACPQAAVSPRGGGAPPAPPPAAGAPTEDFFGFDAPPPPQHQQQHQQQHQFAAELAVVGPAAAAFDAFGGGGDIGGSADFGAFAGGGNVGNGGNGGFGGGSGFSAPPTAVPHDPFASAPQPQAAGQPAPLGGVAGSVGGGGGSGYAFVSGAPAGLCAQPVPEVQPIMAGGDIGGGMQQKPMQSMQPMGANPMGGSSGSGFGFMTASSFDLGPSPAASSSSSSGDSKGSRVRGDDFGAFADLGVLKPAGGTSQPLAPRTAAQMQPMGMQPMGIQPMGGGGMPTRSSSEPIMQQLQQQQQQQQKQQQQQPMLMGGGIMMGGGGMMQQQPMMGQPPMMRGVSAPMQHQQHIMMMQQQYQQQLQHQQGGMGVGMGGGMGGGMSGGMGNGGAVGGPMDPSNATSKSAFSISGLMDPLTGKPTFGQAPDGYTASGGDPFAGLMGGRR